MLQAHEVAHQWWGNRVTPATYRDNWLMEALANCSALLYLEKRRGTRAVENMLDSYRESLLAKNEAGQVVDSAGPIVLGTRLESSQEPRGWRAITYGKGSWIMQMLRARMGDERFLALLAEISKRYDRKDITTEEFRLLAAEYLPPKSDDPKLESFLRTVGVRDGHPDNQADVDGEGRGAEREAGGHGDAIRRGSGFHGGGAGGDCDREGPDDDALGAVGRRAGDVHGGAEGGSAEGDAGSALRAVEAVRG